MYWSKEEKRQILGILSSIATDCYSNDSSLGHLDAQLLIRFLQSFQNGSYQEARELLQILDKKKRLHNSIRPSNILYIASMDFSFPKSKIAESTAHIGFPEEKIRILNELDAIKSSGLEKLIKNKENVFFVGQVPHSIQGSISLLKRIRMSPDLYSNVFIMESGKGRLSGSLDSVRKAIHLFEKRFPLPNLKSA